MAKPNVNDVVAFADLSGKDLSGMDLTGKDMRGVNLTGANLKGANLNGTVLQGADLTNAKYDSLDGADIRWAKGLPEDAAQEAGRQEQHQEQLTQDEVGDGVGKVRVKVKDLKPAGTPDQLNAPTAKNESETIVPEGFNKSVTNPVISGDNVETKGS